ncbi:MAG: PhoH family protein [Bdellovibrionales bacterium]|nr:PhoH family protein [Bdellovibrionales bacterium]
MTQQDKTFVLDTNVLLFDPQAIYKFGDNHVVIPITVIEEIDRFKKDLNENGRNARQFSRMLDALRDKGSLSKGVAMNGKTGTLRVVMFHESTEIPEELHSDKADNRILGVAFAELKDKGPERVVFITKDVNLRIKSDALGIPAEDYESTKVPIEELYSGVGVFDVSADDITTFYSEKRLPIEDPELYPNGFVILRDRNNPSHSAVGRFDVRMGSVVPLMTATEGVWGLHPKNVEQTFALDLLLNDDIQLVSLVGKAGTGKTLLAIAAGLQKTLDEGKFQRLLVSRPIFPMGKDVGYLPGDIEQKLNPWMQPIFDNIEFLMGGSERRHGRGGAARGIQELMNQGMVNIEPLTYIRGRSIPNQFLIVDEAQNLTPHEIKTILTRAGENTKVVLTGDCYQIDNPYVDSASNGLAHVVERMKLEEISGHITLMKGERSPLAELASNLL